MASEKKVFNIIKEAGFEPIEDKGIIVKYAPENLSAKIAQFFSLEYYVLQLFKSELIFLPFSTITAGLKREIALQLPYSTIQTVSVKEDLLNYLISITTDTDTITLSTQQKELSDFRSAGFLTFGGLTASNWHKKNFDGTLKTLQSLNS